jgi:hypothetical protein
MSEWCMAHPWMTFFLAALAILALDSIASNICTVAMHWRTKVKP